MISSPPDAAEMVLPFPRTGKRGVPQQFPRRLFEMLNQESTKNVAERSVVHPQIISWSLSGKAFRIYNVTDFATTILPKYFRTTKFSSFQRNLNLVSFSIECCYFYILGEVNIGFW
jgi:HSF-type DNA-binding